MKIVHRYMGKLGLLSFGKHLLMADLVVGLIGYLVFKHVFLIGSMINLVSVILFTSLLIKYWIWCRINY